MGTGNAHFTNKSSSGPNRRLPTPHTHWMLALGIACCLFVGYLMLPDQSPLVNNDANPLEALSSSQIEFVYTLTDSAPAANRLEKKNSTASTQRLTNTPHDALKVTEDDATQSTVIANVDTRITDTASKIIPSPEKYKLEAPLSTQARRLQSTVQSGDSLFKIFTRLGLSHSTLDKIVSSYDDPASPLRYIYPGQTIDFTVDSDTNALVEFAFDKDRLTQVIISRNEDGEFIVNERSRIVQVETAFAEGHVTGAFYLAAKEAGITDKTILQFVDIFAWDLDFTQDIRENDSFQIAYERNHLDDGTVEPGRILTARFVNRGKPITAIAFTDPAGKTSYYTPEGNNVRKAFLRSPVDFARISSHFNLNRKHPVLHTIRAHKGVDYAARRGTPVKATGDGKVIFKGRKGGYGRVVILQHGKEYSTLYAHLQGYAKQLSEGDRVKQNEIIGFIGSSGLATGPHLHYEFRVNNVHKNPLTVKFPNAAPVSKKHRAAFEETARLRLAELNALQQTTVAHSDATQT